MATARLRLRAATFAAAAMAATLIASVLVVVPAQAAPNPAGGKAAGAPDRSTAVSKVGVKAAAKAESDGAATKGLPVPSWPAAGSADSAGSGAGVTPGGLPVRVLTGVASDAAPRTRKELTAAPVAVPVRVSVADQQAAAAANVRGVLLQVTRADGTPNATSVGLSVGYGRFATGYGADYGSRLGLVSLPACALTTPSLPACQRQTPIASENDVTAQTVTAKQVPVSGSLTVMALASAPSGTGSSGNWTATDLSPSYSWASGTGSGDFSLSYPLKAPASPGGPAPQMQLAYSSQSVDAKTAAKTGQSSVVGEGWDLTGGGYVERSFRTCYDDGLSIPDECWVSDGAVTLVFGGRAVKLVKDAGGAWHANADDKLRIDNLTATGAISNNAVNGEHWRVTTQDGTQYYFGKVHRYAGDTADTSSVLFEPVFGNNAGEPCYPNWCQHAYRWNLDYVVDPLGNTMTYFYGKIVGKYGPAGALYDLSAQLDRVDYGTRTGTEAASTAPMRVVFGYEDRCWNTCSWPASGFADTPGDLWCAPSATSCSNVLAPVHFTRYRLSSVQAQVYTGSAYRTADRWDLEQTFLTSGDSISPAGDDTAPNLWLNGVTHTGVAPDGTTLAEPQTSFGGARLANRADWGNNLGMAPFMHWRITQVNNGVGGQTLVDYLPTDCVNQWPKTNPDSNPSRCFPMYYKGPDPSTPPGTGFFNKYVVNTVTERDLTGTSPDEVTSYAYSADGSNDSALWAVDDVDVANVAYASWADWRGYPSVTVTHGAVAGQQTVTKTIYHRGMHGDAKRSGDDTQTLFGQRSAFTLEPLQQSAEVPVALAGGGTLDAGALCLDILYAQNFDGAPLQTIGCYAGDYQKWVRVMDGTQAYRNPATGKCLDTHGAVNGSPVWLWTCNGTPAQRWVRQPDGSLKNPSSGRCLDVSSYNLQAGGAPQLWDCAGRWNQVWMPSAGYQLVMTQNNRCAGIAGNTDGAMVQNQACNAADNIAAQTWTLKRDGTVVNDGGRCLDIQGGGTANNTAVQLWSCTPGQANQVWQAQSDGSLKNPASGRCLDTTGNAVDLQALRIWDCNGAVSQKWVGRTHDHAALGGQVRASYEYDNGAVSSVTVHRYQKTLTATRNAYTTPGATVPAWMTRENQTSSGTRINATNTWRWTYQATTYDSYGLPTDVNDAGDVGNGTDDTCTHTDYARNTGLYLIDYPSQVVTTDCAASTADGNYLRGTQTLYDGSATAGAAPTLGLATQSNALSTVAGTALTWTRQGTTTYDPNGRTLDTFDALNHKTMTRYTPASGGPVTAVTVTNAKLQATVTTLEPGHGVPVSVLDANNQTTTAQYDQLGRLVKVWNAGRATNLTPDAEYGYTLSNSAPNVETVKKLGPNGNQIVSTTLYDGQLRVRQTQAPAAQAKGGRIVADTRYDGRGLAWQQSTFWDSTTAPGPALAGFSNTGVQQQTRTTFDSLERPTVLAQYAADVFKWQSTTSYDGDSVTVLPPAGATPTKKTLDAAGNVTELRQYTAGSLAGASQATTYEYDRLGQQTKTTDAAGNVWSTTYDRLGRTTAATDPDGGGASYGYDVAGNITSTTDGRNVTLAYDYDELNRRTGRFEGTLAGTKRADWVYDTVRKGALTSSSRYSGGLTYTTSIGGYDAQGRPLNVTVGLPLSSTLPSGSYTSSKTYNADGSVATQTYPSAGGLAAETVTYTYDTSGRPLSVAGQDTYIADTSYYGFGPVYQQVLGSGTKHVRRTTSIEEATGRPTASLVETQNQVTTTNWDVQLNQAYGYDAAGNVTSVKESNGSGVVANQCFTYDGLRELTEAWTTTAAACRATPTQAIVGGTDAYWTSYGYQLTNGNRTSEVKHAAGGNTTRGYVYPASGANSVRPHTITRVDITGATTGTDTYGYDSAGNLTTRNLAGRPGQSLTWDKEGHLGTVTDTGGTTTYTYDADGKRLVAVDPLGTTVYLDGFDLRLQSGSTTCTRFYGDAASRGPAGLTWLAADPHGTAELAVNATTLAVTHRRLDPFGNPRAAGPVWPNTRAFVGGTADGTGLTHLGAREYEPTTGRFVSDDPILDFSDPQQLGGYSYSNSNPATFSDPQGTCAICNLVRRTKRSMARRIVSEMAAIRSRPTQERGKDSCKTIRSCDHKAEQEVLASKQCRTIRSCDAKAEQDVLDQKHKTIASASAKVYRNSIPWLLPVSGGTGGLCVNEGAGILVAGGASACLGEDQNGLFLYSTTSHPGDPHGAVGVGAGVGVRTELSNAANKDDLRGEFTFVEGSGGPYQGGVAWGDSNDGPVFMDYAGGSLGVASVAGGTSDTKVGSYFYTWPWKEPGNPEQTKARKLS